MNSYSKNMHIIKQYLVMFRQPALCWIK